MWRGEESEGFYSSKKQISKSLPEADTDPAPLVNWEMQCIELTAKFSFCLTGHIKWDKAFGGSAVMMLEFCLYL